MRSKAFLRQFSASCVLGASVALGGCARDINPFSGAQEGGLSPAEAQLIATAPPELFGDLSQLAYTTNIGARNNYISMRMFMIDRRFADYSHRLSHQDTFIRLLGDMTQLGLTTAGATIPAGQVTKVLSAVATSVGGAKALYDKDVLVSQAIQLVQAQMRTDRATIRAAIVGRMRCPTATYPAGMVLSDLQSYADAGSMTSALTSLNRTAVNAETTAATDQANATTPAAASPTVNQTKAETRPASTSGCPIGA